VYTTNGLIQVLCPLRLGSDREPRVLRRTVSNDSSVRGYTCGSYSISEYSLRGERAALLAVCPCERRLVPRCR